MWVKLRVVCLAQSQTGSDTRHDVAACHTVYDGHSIGQRSLETQGACLAWTQTGQATLIDTAVPVPGKISYHDGPVIAELVFLLMKCHMNG